jgi:copper homeostasis protein
MTDFVARILTSGPAASAPGGREGLRRWVETFGEHYRFAVGGGVRFENARDIVLYTGAHECHVGSAVRINGAVDAGRVGDLLAILRA